MTSDSSTDHWDFYSCEIDGQPHSTMVNLSLFGLAPIPKLSFFHCIEVTLKYPDPEHGMTTNEDFQPLNDMEDWIQQGETEHLRYVARQTGGGKRKFYFYAHPEFDFIAFVNDLDHTFPTYEKTTFNFEDVHWRTYFENLYPNAIAMNEISNRSVLVNLQANGDNLDIPREIDHTIIFNSRNQAEKFASIAERKGFTVETNVTGVFQKTYELLVQRVDAPSSLDPITYELQELASDLGGSYDGWGCMVQTSNER